jgi:hypothetical protein
MPGALCPKAFDIEFQRKPMPYAVARTKLQELQCRCNLMDATQRIRKILAGMYCET